MLASLAYTESNFDTTAVSWAGAKGLMQLMPATARAMGVPPGKEQNPEESVKAAIKYITATDRSFSMIPDKQERLNFILAYNAGLGHIYDAMALAEKYGKNKLVWKDNVEASSCLKAIKNTSTILSAKTDISVASRLTISFEILCRAMNPTKRK